MKFFLMIFTILLFVSCSYQEKDTKIEEEEVEKKFSVQMQVVGSLIEGLTVCYDKNNICKQTDKNGMVEFDFFGNYSFKIRDINLSTLTIENNRTIISPYTLFDKNETLARRSILLIHAFDKGTKIDDEEVLLSLSSYIPKVNDFLTLLSKTKLKIVPKDINDSSHFVDEYELLGYITNDFNISDSKEHNITINFTENNITRDGKETHLVIPTKSTYESLNGIMKFIDLANDKNVSFDNFNQKYLLTKKSLTSFNLGDKYIVNSIVKEDHVVMEFFDNASRIKDETILIISDEDDVLSTNILDLRIRQENNLISQ